MIVRHRNKQSSQDEKFTSFVNYLEASDYIWIYYGMKVELDPVVDWQNKNILIHWTDISEGFNDRKIYYNIEEFDNDFSKYEHD